MNRWMRRARRKLTRLAPKIAQMLGLPEKPFQLFWTDGGVAATDAAGGKIYLNWEYFKDHQDDWGALAHEYAHLVQNVPGGYGGPCGRWIEPMADAVRYKLGLYDPKVWFPSPDVLDLDRLSLADFRALSRRMSTGDC